MIKREIEDRVQRAIPLIQDPESPELWKVIEYLGNYGTNHPAAIDFLIKCINDHFRWDRYIYWKALYNLGKILGPGGAEYLPRDIRGEILDLLEPGSRKKLAILVQLIGSLSQHSRKEIVQRLADTLVETQLIAAIRENLEPYIRRDPPESSRAADCEMAIKLGKEILRQQQQ